jgi:maltooligosyltrehalose trehalohydrolase
VNIPDGSCHLHLPPLGSVPNADGTTSFLIWAPEITELGVHLLGDDRVENLERDQRGYHHAALEGVSPGDLFRLVLPSGDELPDPASRSQPQGVHGPTEVFDPDAFGWSDPQFAAPALWDMVIYELHVGTFSEEGTFEGAARLLDHIVELGANTVELMPVAQFPGKRNWGYDGVFPYAAQDTYGGPSGLQRFVDTCHSRGLAVVLDVVYNHIGPEGNVLPRFGPYFTDRYRTPWGEAVNVDGKFSDEVRRYLVGNALWWFGSFHVDALRLDAVHGIVDTTARPFLMELVEATDALGKRLGRPLHLIAESADNNPRLISPSASGGLGLDAQWNDDFHHALHSVVTGERSGYYSDFGELDQVATSISKGFVLQGQYSRHYKRRHGAPSDQVPPERFVVFDQNHDQIGNRPAGDRLSSRLDTERLRLTAAVMLLSPYVPLLFMGEEYAENAPFPYFVDHSDPRLMSAVRRGRADEMRHIGFEGEQLDPTDPRTFERARLDLGLRDAGGEHARVWATYRSLIELRRTHPAFGRGPRAGNSADVVGESVLKMSRRGEVGGEAVALFNFRAEPARIALPDCPGGLWRKLADSGDPEIGGSGAVLSDEAPGGAELTLATGAFCVYES